MIVQMIHQRGGQAMKFVDDSGWEKLTQEEKKKVLFQKQKEVLDDFLERGAITKAQYDKSLGDMKKKMGYND